MTYRFEHDPQSDAIYVRLREGTYHETLPLSELGVGAGVDVDEEGYVLGVEFLSFGEFALVVEHHGGVLEIPERMERGSDEAESAETGGAATLTPRQRDVLQLLAEGKNNREIAERLSVSLSTVRRDIDRMIRVLGMRSRDEARGRPAARGTG